MNRIQKQNLLLVMFMTCLTVLSACGGGGASSGSESGSQVSLRTSDPANQYIRNKDPSTPAALIIIDSTGKESTTLIAEKDSSGKVLKTKGLLTENKDGTTSYLTLNDDGTPKALVYSDRSRVVFNNYNQTTKTIDVILYDANNKVIGTSFSFPFDNTNSPFIGSGTNAPVNALVSALVVGEPLTDLKVEKAFGWYLSVKNTVVCGVGIATAGATAGASLVVSAGSCLSVVVSIADFAINKSVDNPPKWVDQSLVIADCTATALSIDPSSYIDGESIYGMARCAKGISTAFKPSSGYATLPNSVPDMKGVYNCNRSYNYSYEGCYNNLSSRGSTNLSNYQISVQNGNKFEFPFSDTASRTHFNIVQNNVINTDGSFKIDVKGKFDSIGSNNVKIVHDFTHIGDGVASNNGYNIVLTLTSKSASCKYTEYRSTTCVKK